VMCSFTRVGLSFSTVLFTMPVTSPLSDRARTRRAEGLGSEIPWP
jgi:hypothetical protein